MVKLSGLLSLSVKNYFIAETAPMIIRGVGYILYIVGLGEKLIQYTPFKDLYGFIKAITVDYKR